MRLPQIVICDPDGWAAKQLRELAAEHRWLIREPRTPAVGLALARQSRISVVVVQVDPASEETAVFATLADFHRLCPDMPVIVLSDTKLPDADRVAWTAMLFDLGARFVLFPPLAKPVLEDAVSGLMTATIRRQIPEASE